MAYNRTMTELTLVLPFALPPPELALDLLRVLQAPALAALLSRTSRQHTQNFDGRILPHEAWLAHALGLAAAPSAPGAAAPFAAAALQGFTGNTEPALAAGHYFLVQPAHVQIARNHLLMGDQRQLALDEADARALFDSAKPYFDEIGKPLSYGDASTWFVRADDWADLRTASPDAAAGQNLSDWMPEGDSARASRKLQNEVQMLWHEHPANLRREERGLTPINAFWLWGGAPAPSPAPTTTLFTFDCPSWLAALAEPARRTADLDLVLRHDGAAALAVLGGLSGAAMATDWSDWLMRMQQLEEQWFVPLLAAVKQGRVKALTLVLTRRDAYAEYSTSKHAQRKFWRPITLKNLTK